MEAAESSAPPPQANWGHKGVCPLFSQALSFSLDADERRIVNFVIENKTIKPADALRVLSTTYWQAARAKLQRLVDRGILDFHAAKKRDPNSYYTVRRVVQNGD